MSKFKSIFKNSEGEEKLIGVFNNRKESISACINFKGNYCLDDAVERKKCLEIRNFYVLGCGPEQFIIKEVE